MHGNQGSWGAHVWLLELGDAEVDHTWMWRLHPHHGAVLEPEEYLDCAGPWEPVPCAASLPKAALGRSRGSILLSQRGPSALSVSSLGARSVRPAPPPCPSLAPRLLIPVRLLPGRPVEVAPQAPLRHGDANGTSTAGATDATPNDRCGARFSVKFSSV